MHGRFTSVDPLMASADILNPQTFNRYVYVGNNPVNMNDPTGEIWGQSGNSLQWFDTEDAMKKAGFSAYDGPMIGMRGDQMYALSATTGAAVAVNSASQLLGQLAAWGATSAAIESAALTLGVAAPLALAYVAAVKYSPGQVDATMDDCMSCGRMIQNHVNMMNKKADELAAQVNAQAKANSQSTPADPNSRKPDPDDNKPRYEQSPKHGKSQRGNVAPAPTNGQATLDTSVQVRSTSPRRVGVDPSTGEFVVFDQTTRGVFHGHVRNWDGLTQGMRNALIKSGQVNRRGKIK